MHDVITNKTIISLRYYTFLFKLNYSESMLLEIYPGLTENLLADDITIDNVRMLFLMDR